MRRPAEHPFSEVVADGARPGDLASFGLANPSSSIVLTTDGAGSAHEVTVFLGDRNPTHTALYARRAEDARVYLVGLNLRYYEDLIFTAAGAIRALRGRSAREPRTKRARCRRRPSARYLRANPVVSPG